MSPSQHDPVTAGSSTPPSPGPTLGERHGDLVAGGIFVVLGGAFAVAARGYGLGSWDEMGAGMFPFVLGLALVGFGVAVAVPVLRGGGEQTPGLSRLPWRAIVCVSAAVVSFAYLLPSVGLIPATATTVFVTCLASPATSLVKAVLGTAGITVACYVIFVVALQLRLPLFGS